MPRNICLNCGYFLNCKYASKEIKECAKYLNVKIRTIRFWCSPANKRRIKEKGKLAIVIDEEK